MKANELRIGNYFNPRNRLGEIHLPIKAMIEKIFIIEPFKVKSCAYDKNFAQVEKMNEFDIADLCEISLTEEWLLKFGFEFDGTSYNKLDKASQNVFQLPAFPNKNGSIQICARISDTYLLELTDVHQLQNLYFALTGKELLV